uniref:Uncharacterized protein n=1 Tax=Caenorhabditis japonica TaxID=281687 RepID=A0A8R1DSM8_CAEJA
MELNPDSEEIWFGIVYFVLSAPQVPLTLLVIISVYRKNQEGSNLTYKLVNVINFTQFVQSTGHLLTAPILIWPALQKMPPVVLQKKRKITSAPKRRDEIAIASQYTFITVYATITLAFWNLSNYRPDNASKSVRAIMNICWQVGIYINPILLLILNRLNF